MLGNWKADVFIQHGSAVGSVMQGAGGDWFAYGFMEDWEDTPLGQFSDKAEAKKTVEDWVSEND